MSLLGEIKRRKVFQVAAVYLVVAWLIMQVVDVVSQPLLLPDLFARIVILLLAIGFPIALILSWAFDLTPEGVVKDQGDIQSSGRRIEYVLIGLLLVAVSWLAYRVEVNPSEQAADLVAEESQREVLPNSVAVLPFENLSPDPSHGYFADGIHEETLSQLARVRDLTVIPRASVLVYANREISIRDVARELRVETVMNGTVRYAENQVRLTVQLIDPQTGGTLWANDYDGDITDIFGVQIEIATAIASAVGARLSAAEVEAISRPPTHSSVAAEIYLRTTTDFRSQTDVAVGADARARIQADLDRAILADPNFSLAYALKAWVYGDSMVGDRIPQQEWAERIESLSALVQEYAAKALDLDPNVGLAHGALAQGLLITGRWTEARDEFERALELTPNDPVILSKYQDSLWCLGRIQASVVYAERLSQLDPNSAFGHRTRAAAYQFARRYGDAAEANRLSLQLDPTDSVAHLLSAAPGIARGDEEAALRALQNAERLFPDDALPGLWAQLAYSYRLLGRTGDVERAVQKFLEASQGLYVPPAQRVWGHLAVAEIDLALAALEEAADDLTSVSGPFPLITLRENIYLDPILETPDFLAARRKIPGFRE